MKSFFKLILKIIKWAIIAFFVLFILSTIEDRLPNIDVDETKKVGNWKKGYFVDEFGDKTGRGYVSQTAMGSFSNSATEGSPLRAVMFINNANLEKETPWLRLYEYDGRNPVKGIFSKNPMSCRIKDQDNIRISIYFSQNEGSDYFFIDEKGTSSLDIADLKSLITDGGTASFACVNDQYGNSKYSFKFDFKYFSNIVRQLSDGT